MTAEVAVLNKSAVALATDSAVTISSGQQTLKIFESADKLFELSDRQPIGIMIYNGMQFLGVPLETVIKGFRRSCPEFNTVEEAANAFFSHLYTYIDNAPDSEIYRSVNSVIAPIAAEISAAMMKEVYERLSSIEAPDNIDDFKTFQAEIFRQVLDKYDAHASSLAKASFWNPPRRKKKADVFKVYLEKAIRDSIDPVPETEVQRIIAICRKVLDSEFVSLSKTGLVFAGFGENEMFPTLVSFEIDGVFENKLRAIKTEHCDIDRNGRKAFVRPFAQKEMVDRFLHGLDDRLRGDITAFSKKAVQKISSGIIDALDLDDDLRITLQKMAQDAETAFIKSLNDDAFTSFQERSRKEIENMVEFMPKPELARMAEALIDLTSIKRKVSQELETVGGPVDVAVISKNDGFVWVKRKHYFPSDLNSRYFNRKNGTAHTARRENDHATKGE